jgi:uncharacterized protein
MSFVAISLNGQKEVSDTVKRQATFSLYQLLTKDTSLGNKWIIDYEGLYTAEQRKRLDSIISDVEQKTTIEICIVTIDSSMTSSKDFDDFVWHIHNTWGIGKSGKDNGIVIGISSVLRKIRISNGEAIEKMLSDSDTKFIIDNSFIPFFKKGGFFEGTLTGLDAILARLDPRRGANQSKKE